ncbi:MAG: TlpA family protein disulfide reductase, partial [Lachnospiraceae bacterium]|nr:TlpA family protein disulfide reductase [Lachnospiraceae bacterium]
MNLKILKAILIPAAAAVLITGCGSDMNETVYTEESSVQTSFEGLDTVDIQGNSITNDFFKQADVTVVNVWGTFCGPCIGEMPELQKWNEEKPDNVQILGIVADISGPQDKEHISLAGSIGDKAGVTFTNIIPDEWLYNNILNSINVVPTTFL